VDVSKALRVPPDCKYSGLNLRSFEIYGFWSRLTDYLQS